MTSATASAPEVSLRDQCVALARRARDAATRLATAPGGVKNRWLRDAADRLESSADAVLAANALDIEAAPEYGLSAAQIDRLRLTPARLRAAAAGLREVAALPDPIGEVLAGSRRANGLEITKVGVPLGVIFFLYESRPNVTLDAAALCVKAGNAVILRGGKEAAHSNAALHAVLADSLAEVGLPADAVLRVPTADRAAVGVLLKLADLIDLVIPRGGESLIRRVTAEAAMPVLKHYLGNCHVYIDKAADIETGVKIIVNSKCQRPGVCNAAEKLLVHRDIAPAFLPRAAAELTAKGVQLRGCERTRALVPGITLAADDDWGAEYLDLILAVKVVDDLGDAIAHINRHGSKHTDAVVTGDLAAARRFTAEVDSAAVMVNASTRFHDGFEFGLGAEIGISTDKLHARGPCGLRELTTYKYVVMGEGQIRE